MPLSEHEQRLLEQMERALYAEDPKFATSMRNPRAGAGDRRLIAVGVLVFLVGMGLLLAGVMTQLVVVGVVGFLAMLGGIWMVIRSWRSAGEPAQPTAQAPRTAPSRQAKPRRTRRGDSLTDRMEERWRRRRERGDF